MTSTVLEREAALTHYNSLVEKVAARTGGTIRYTSHGHAIADHYPTGNPALTVTVAATFTGMTVSYWVERGEGHTSWGGAKEYKSVAAAVRRVRELNR